MGAVREGRLERVYGCGDCDLEHTLFLRADGSDGAMRTSAVRLRVGKPPVIGGGSCMPDALAPLLPDAPVTHILSIGSATLIAQGTHLVRFRYRTGELVPEAACPDAALFRDQIRALPEALRTDLLRAMAAVPRA